MWRFQQFRDRTDAGRKLATPLAVQAIERPIVLAVPRGGVPVAAEIAAALGAPLDLLFVRKLGAPRNPEVAIGAVAIAGAGVAQTVFNEDVIAASGAARGYIDAEIARQRSEIDRQRRLYLGASPGEGCAGVSAIDLAGRHVIVVDDGVATGATLAAALKALRPMGARSVTVALPVGPPEAIRLLQQAADRVVCLHRIEDFIAVGAYYRAFPQVGDEEVIGALAARHASGP